MPNIMLTYRCNLHCSYCFANEFVNKEKTDISIPNFMKALSFVTNDGKVNIGLIGGEPTLHPAFQMIMEMLIGNPKVSGITLYTNGLLMDRYIPQLVHPKVRILVNCNSPLIIGENAFASMRKNLDTLMRQYYMKNRVNLGINLYSSEIDYTYMMELLQRYKMHSVRISVTVPDFSTGGQVDALEYFKGKKEFLLKFFRDMDGIQVLPYYDCNKPPYCIWTDEEKEWLETYRARYPRIESDLTGHQSKCFPVIDILPNLQVVRCFGMSDFMKVNLEDFRNVSDIGCFFQQQIDSCAYRLAACGECKECYEQKTKHCLQGCIGFKAAGIRSCNKAIEGI